EPQAVASTISSGDAPVAATRGAATPPAVVTATVAEPKAIRNSAAMSHARNRGLKSHEPAELAICSAIPAETSTSLKAPPAPITKRIIAMALAASLMEVDTSDIVLPQPGPNTNRATNSVISNAIGAEPTACSTDSKAGVGWLLIRIISAPAIRTIGAIATTNDIAVGGISSSENSRSVTSPAGNLGEILRTNGSRGQIIAIAAPVGRAIISPYANVNPTEAS